MKELFIMVGCPGAGKSTWIMKHLSNFKGFTKIVSRDEIRFSMVAENEEYFSKEKEVFKKYVEEIREGLKRYDNVIADATHLNEASRNKLLRAICCSLHGVKVNAIWIKVPLETALERNKMREGTRSFVPESAIKRMHSQITEPSFVEGFDKVYIYKNGQVKIKVGDKQ